MENETLTLTHVQDLIDELVQANGYWAGELTMLGCATLFDLELDEADVEDLTAVLFDDDYGDTELDLVAQALAEREADPEVLNWNDLVLVGERFDVDPKVLSAELAEITDDAAWL